MIDFINKAKKLGIDLEIFENNSKQIAIKIDSSKIRTYEISDSKLYKIKNCIDNKFFTITTEKLSDELFDKILKVANNIENVDSDEFANGNISEKVITPITIEDDFLDKLIKATASLKKEYSFNEVVLTIYLSFESKNIKNTIGTSLYQNNNAVDITAELIFDNQGKTESKFLYRSFCDLKFDEIISKFKSEIEYEMFGIKQLNVSSGKYNVILKNGVMGSLINKFMKDFEASEINKKISYFTNDFNQKIASSKFSLIEDPQNKKLPRCQLFDTEGSQTIYKEIIKNGIFNAKLYNKKEAIKENIESTGNSYGFTNVYIKKGNSSFQELVVKMNDGIIIDDVFGTHSGINNITGDISLQASGKLVSNGKIIGPLKNIILNTNFKELLNNINEIGNDFETRGKMSTVSILFDNISITGNEE